MFGFRKKKNTADSVKSKTDIVVADNDGKLYSVIHSVSAYNDNDIPYCGKYIVTTDKNKTAGYLKYVFRYDKKPQYMLLSDIVIEYKYRNRGLGTKLIALFEEMSKSLGAEYIEGNLSSVDEDGENHILRDNFYINRGYEINNGKVFKQL